MTAINVWKSADAVHVVTDGRVSTPLATLSNTSKVACLPHLNAVVAVRGTARLLGIMSLWLSVDTENFEDVAAKLERLKTIKAELTEFWQVVTLRQDFDVVVAGIGKDGPAAFFVPSHGKHGFPAWKVLDVAMLATPTVDPALLDRVFGASDPVSRMADLVDAQRANPTVGGFVQMTTVMRRGIVTEIVRDYR